MSIFPGSASAGQQFTTASNITYTFNGESWTITSTKGILTVTSTTRPGSPNEGQLIYETDTDLVLVWNGTEWTEISGGGGTVLFQDEQPDVSQLDPGALWVDSNENVGTGLDIQTFLRWSKVLSASTSIISGYDSNNLNLLYTPGYEQVYINGTLINRGVDYSATDGNNIVLTESASVGDLIEVHAFESFGIADVYTKTESDNRYFLNSASSNFETNIPFSSTAPQNPITGNLWVDSSGVNPMMKVWDGNSWESLGSAPVPIITGIAPDNISGSASTAIIVNGQNFESGSIVKLINTSNTELFTLSTTFNNSRSLQILTPALTASAGPYDIKVTNPDNQISILENALTVGVSPVWSTTAGSLGTIYDSGRSSTTFSVSATDADNQNIIYELVSGSLPTGMTITSGGTISGTAAAVASDTTYAFTIRARDTANNYVDRSFSITTKPPQVQSFTTVGSTSWISPTNGNIQVLVVAGGGGGGLQVGGGGGAGGLIYNTSYSVTANSSYTVTVGGGGAGASSSNVPGSNGQNSIFGNLIAIGGGGGGSHANNGVSTSGGSGGGGGGGNSSGTGGSPGTAGQGNSGGIGRVSNWAGGGGGGAGFAGQSSPSNGQGGAGGDGLAIGITGSNIYYAGGGGGCSDGSNSGSSGGLGGGGAGRSNAANGVQNGTANTGGGGGGIRDTGSPGTGGSGVVILRY